MKANYVPTSTLVHVAVLPDNEVVTDVKPTCCRARKSLACSLKVGFKRSDSYIAQLTRLRDPRALQSRKWQLIGKSQWCCSANCGHLIARVNVQLDPRYAAIANTLPVTIPLSTTPGLHPVSIHHMSPLVRGSKHLITAHYSIYRPRKDERTSWPNWLTNISGHSSAAGPAQDRESSPAKDRCSTTVPRHQT